MALQNCCVENVNTYLQGIYFIPAYQREYSWEQNEVEDFWKDLTYTKNTVDVDFKPTTAAISPQYAVSISVLVLAFI